MYEKVGCNLLLIFNSIKQALTSYKRLAFLYYFQIFNKTKSQT